MSAAPLSFRATECADLLARFARISDDSANVEWWLTTAHSMLLVGLILQFVGLFGIGGGAARAAFAIETLLLLLLFGGAPPLLAVACYFIFVHSWRHLRRLKNYETLSIAVSFEKTPSRFDSRRRKIGQPHRQGLPFTLLALLGIGLPLVVSTRAAPIAAINWTIIYLVLLSILTLPHTLVVGWLDWRNLR